MQGVMKRDGRTLDHGTLEVGWTTPNGIMCQSAGCRNLQKEPSAMSITMIGLDTAKMVCSQKTNSA
jgi:hypothetical protein